MEKLGVVVMPKGFKEAYQKFFEGGWFGMVHNPEYGGQGLPNIFKFITLEIFWGANSSMCLTGLLTEGTAHLIERFGDEAMRRLYCEKLYSSEWAGTMCLTEPGAGSDVGALKSTAKRNGDHFLITGSKIFISAGEHDATPNIIHAVLARIEGAPAGTKGISLFTVPKYLVGEDGSIGERNDLICSGIEHKMGIRGSPTASLSFGDEGKCQGWLIGEENAGMKLMFQMMNESRLGVGVQGLGLASAAYLSALGYAQQRVQGPSYLAGKEPNAPKVPIIDHPDVRRMMLHMKSVTDGLRSLMYAVGKYIDLAEHAEDEKDRDRYNGYVELLTPICKGYGMDMGFRVNEMAIQTYGGYGYCQEYPVEQYCRDQKISSVYEGTNGIQALDLLGRKIASNRGVWLGHFVEMVEAFIEEHRENKDLGSLVTQFAQSKNDYLRSTQEILSQMAKDPTHPMLQACPYMEMFGHVVVAYYLLDGATKANKKLQDLYARNNAKNYAARKELLAQNSEAAFYHGRVASARYFVNHVLPHVQAIAAIIKNGDVSPMEAVYPS